MGLQHEECSRWPGVIKETGFKRFKRAYSEIPKGNGKSPLAAALCDIMAFMDDEPGAEVYACATSVDQAKVVFETSQSMLQKMSQVCERKGINVAAHSINQKSTNSFYRILSTERNSPEGSIPYFLCVDELHAHATRFFFDNLDNSTGKRDGSMMWMITTAGEDTSSVCYEQHEYVKAILRKEVEDDSYFGIIYTIDDTDDWATIEAARKANPNWGVSVPPDEIANKLRKALQLPSAQATYKTKHLGLWSNSDRAWMNMVKWAQCADAKLDIVDFAGRDVVLGSDVANKLDILAKLYIFWVDKEETKVHADTGEERVVAKRHYYVFGKYWLPEETVEQATNAQYKGWVAAGLLNTSWGAENDYDEFEATFKDDATKYNIKEAAFDEWGSEMIIQHLNNEGILAVKVSQNTKNFSPAMRELEAAVAEGRFHHNGDPVLTWAINNVAAHPDRNDNLFPNKVGDNKKIDPATALLTGLNRLMMIAIEAPKDFWWASSK